MVKFLIAAIVALLIGVAGIAGALTATDTEAVGYLVSGVVGYAGIIAAFAILMMGFATAETRRS